jgi:hypothetical protein
MSVFLVRLIQMYKLLLGKAYISVAGVFSANKRRNSQEVELIL